jgi:hypothetical protein
MATIMKKTILVGLLLVATMAVATTGTVSVAYAANDDNPSRDNAIQNFKKHRDRVDSDPDLPGDGNPNNDHGQQNAADNVRDKF